MLGIEGTLYQMENGIQSSNSQYLKIYIVMQKEHNSGCLWFLVPI